MEYSNHQDENVVDVATKPKHIEILESYDLNEESIEKIVVKYLESSKTNYIRDPLLKQVLNENFVKDVENLLCIL